MNNEHFIALDCETGGLDSSEHALLSIAAVPSWDAQPLHIYVTPVGQIDPAAVAVNGYTPELWAARRAVIPKIAAITLQYWLHNLPRPCPRFDMAAHNAGFDSLFISALCERTGIDIGLPGVWHCTKLKLQQLRTDGILPDGPNHLDDLGHLSGYWDIDPRSDNHDALQDARCVKHGLLWIRQQRAAHEKGKGAAA